jgi:urea transporter
MKKDDKEVLAIIGVMIQVIVLVAVGPLLTLLALNTLFPTLAIPYTFGTWLATLWVMMVINGKVKT